MIVALALALAAHTLLDPTPDSALRPLRTDRPDLTEGPYTVDAGHLQLESDLGVVGVEGAGAGLGVDVDVFSVNARVGVTDAVDVHVIVPVVGARFVDGDAAARVGELVLRAKWNLFGNEDGSDLALALLPYLVVPAGYEVTGGLIVPVDVALPADLGLGAMVAVEAVRDGAALDAEVIVSASLAYDVGGGVGVYVEGLASGVVLQGSGEAWASAGTTFSVAPDVQLDAGARALVVGGAPRAEGFVGVSVRR